MVTINRHRLTIRLFIQWIHKCYINGMRCVNITDRFCGEKLVLTLFLCFCPRQVQVKAEFVKHRLISLSVAPPFSLPSLVPFARSLLYLWKLYNHVFIELPADCRRHSPACYVYDWAERGLTFDKLSAFDVCLSFCLSWQLCLHALLIVIQFGMNVLGKKVERRICKDILYFLSLSKWWAFF